MSANGVLLATMQYVGTVQLNDIFGFYQAPATVAVTTLQLTAQVGAIGGRVEVTLINSAGASLGAVVTILSGTKYRNQGLATQLILPRGTQVRAQITAVDALVAAYLTLNLFGASAQLPSGPSCCGPNYYNGCYQPCGC